ncbi:Por secretion system C-terminal sorting domain-containing protein [Formosa sp. Hel1_31_208]|uniref:FG-GAP-like repeat-containing protein n=1 Tax=Formosa sp. Hel1_31_208 TaxID=1798225 RepID=UPI0008795EC3|nr:FG-GAP-like repeat-containing protein [Formosa sp. Hel1_31_208]SDR72480.1 Por secretion system C-terminal sorting domain-containing protein [Formosa sp. Hel1_31_208]
MKSKLLLLTILSLAFCIQSFGQPANDNVSGAIPITPSPEGTGCTSATFNLPFSTDGTTDSGVQGGCRLSGLDQFFTWTATETGLYFSSQSPGNPGLVVWDATGTIEIACTDTFATTTISGWNVGDNLILQIYDFEGTALSDVAFCLEAIDYIVPPPVPVTFTSSTSGTSGQYKIGAFDMNGDFLDDLVSISSDNVNIREQLPAGGFTTKNIPTSNADYVPTWSLAAADYDRNGYTDLLYGNGSGVTFMRANNTGTGFTEISGPEYVFSQRSNFIDINNDGNLDAFVCHDVAPNVYYLNDGSGNLTFNQGGLGDYPSGGNYGSIWIDYDNDRDMDMFIAKCGGETARRINQMFTNDGNENYTENAAAIGLADDMQTWSAAWGDFDGDGDMDVFVGASSGPHKLMINNNGVFADVTGASGISALTSNSTETVTFDFDNDGNLDLVSGGNILFGKGDMTFDVYPGVFPGSGAYGDLNNDGYIDAFNSGSIFINNAESNNNWIKVHTIGTISNINGIGARVEVHTNAGIKIRDVKSGDGFRYMNSLNTHIGIGTETTINSVVIYWPSGTIDTISNPDINDTLEVVEGATLSLENSLTDKLIIYPNPVKDILNVEFLELNASTIYTIFDITGKRVLNSKLQSTTIDVSNLSPGNYILRIVSGTSIQSQKFIKN